MVGEGAVPEDAEDELVLIKRLLLAVIELWDWDTVDGPVLDGLVVAVEEVGRKFAVDAVKLLAVASRALNSDMLNIFFYFYQ